MGTQKDNRINYYDNLRFFLITMVVIGHFTSEVLPIPDTFRSIVLWVYSFHMPLFIFISGMFHKNEKIVPKVTRFVMIGFALNITSLLRKIIMGEAASISYFGTSGPPWFMFILAGYTAFSYLLRKMDKRSILIFSIIISLFAGYDSSLGDTFFAARFIVFYPFFVMGNMVSIDKPLKVLEKKWVRVIGILIIAFWAAICIFKIDSVSILKPLFSGRSPYGKNFGTLAFLYRGLAYIITVIASFGVMCLIPKGKIPVVTRFGGRTLQIYFWHYFILRILLYFQLGEMLCADRTGKLIWLLLAVVCTFVTGLKPFGFPANQIIKLSRYAKEQTEKEKNEKN